MDDIKYWIWLSSLPGIGPNKFKQLIEFFGSPFDVWNAKREQLEKVQTLNKLIPGILNQKFRDNLDCYMHKIEKMGIRVVRSIDKEYPPLLKEIHDPPPVLYIKGSFEKSDENAVAIVGSRKATPYGINMAKELAYELSVRGITVVSGMARGVDTCSHEGALEAEGRTIAVLGCGVDIPYPPENKELIDKVSKEGAVISEFPIGMEPLAGNFPARNRIISGLSMGVVVIEAGEKSGSLITADFALEQGREVFAVPGSVKSCESKGANALIKQGAKMVTCIEDILEEFSALCTVGSKQGKVENHTYNNLNEDEKKIIYSMEEEPMHIDIISQKTGYNIQRVNATMTIMELKGILKQLPGKFFVKA